MLVQAMSTISVVTTVVVAVASENEAQSEGGEHYYRLPTS